MDVPVDGDVAAEGTVPGRQLLLAGVRRRRPPEVAGGGMDQPEIALVAPLGEAAQPGDPVLAQALRRPWCQDPEHVLSQPVGAGAAAVTFGLPVGAPEHLVGVADDALPAELADAVDDLGRAGTGDGQIAAVEDEVGRPATIFGIAMGVTANVIMLGVIPWALCLAMIGSVATHWLIRRCSRDRNIIYTEIHCSEQGKRTHWFRKHNHADITRTAAGVVWSYKAK